MGENQRLFRVESTVPSDNDKDLRRLTDRIREETFTNLEGWYRLGLALLKTGQSEKTKQVYGMLLEQETHESKKARIYSPLGLAKSDQGEYKEAMTFFEKSLEI